MDKQTEPLVFFRSGTTLYEKGGERTNYEKLHNLHLDGINFIVYRKSDGRNITDRVLENIEKKIWTDQELEILQKLYGKYTLQELHKTYLPQKSVGQIRHQASQLSLTVDKRWAEHEVEALVAMRNSGVSHPIIAKILERPRHAVEVKAKKIGLTFSGRRKDNLIDVEDSIAGVKNLPAISKGKIAEDIASIELTKNGYDVFVPYTPQHSPTQNGFDGSQKKYGGETAG